MATGPVVVEEVRGRLGGSASATDEKCQEAIDIASGHIIPLLKPEWRDPVGEIAPSVEPWPADLHDGVLIASVLTYRNMEAPQAVPAAYTLDGAPQVVPITWDARVRQRIMRYLHPAALVG